MVMVQIPFEIVMFFFAGYNNLSCTNSCYVYAAGRFTYTLKGNFSAELPNHISSTLERNVFLLLSTAIHSPLP